MGLSQWLSNGADRSEQFGLGHGADRWRHYGPSEPDAGTQLALAVQSRASVRYALTLGWALIATSAQAAGRKVLTQLRRSARIRAIMIPASGGRGIPGRGRSVAGPANHMRKPGWST
jgi:hypothetical protein